MTWQRILDIGHDTICIRVVEGYYVEVNIPDGDLLTPLDANELGDVLKKAARFATRERELTTTKRRSA